MSPGSLTKNFMNDISLYLLYLTRTDSESSRANNFPYRIYIHPNLIQGLQFHGTYTKVTHMKTCSKGHQLDPNLTMETFSIPVQSCAEELWGPKVCLLRLRCHLLLIARVNILMHTHASYGLTRLDLLLESNFDEPNH